MLFRRAWRGILNHLAGDGPKKLPATKAKSRLLLEALEDRLVPTNYFVSTLGSDANLGSAAAPFHSIQHAVNAAVSGDQIFVAEGIYGYDPASGNPVANQVGVTAAVTIFDKSLTLRGGFNNSFTALDTNAFRTYISGGSALRCVYVVSNTTDVSLDMEGFTIVSGRATGLAPHGVGNDQIYGFGGGMWVNASARLGSASPGSIVLRDVVFRGNLAVGNDTAGVGGYGAGGGLDLRDVPSVTLQRVVFDRNVAQGGSGSTRGGNAVGGAIHMDGSNLTADTVTFLNNSAIAGSSGGSGVDGTGNTADAAGGALADQISSSATLTNVIALNNSSIGGYAPNGNAGGATGGAFFAEGASLSLINADIRNNVVQGGTGANGGLAGGGGVETLNSNLSMFQAQVIANLATGGAGVNNAGSPGGGGLYLTRLGTSAATTIALTNTVIADNLVRFAGGGNTNVGGGGGGLWLQGVAATLTHATIANNQLASPLVFGQGILMLDNGAQTPTTATINYSIIANHTNTSGAAALDVRNSGGTNAVTLNQVLYANNSVDDNSNGGIDPPGGFSGLNTVTRAANALFTSPGPVNFDYSIQANSPAVNRGIGSTLTVDINNNKRTGTPDLGAYEAPAAPRARSSVALFDPETAIWQLRNSNAGGFFPDGPVFAYGSGGGNSKPVVGDWTGKGFKSVGVVEVKAYDFNGQPFLTDKNGNALLVSVFELKNSNTAGTPDIIVPYGSFSATPVVGNWNNNPQHIDYIGVVETFTGVATWKLHTNFFRGTPEIQFLYGGVTSIPVVGDWNGDGTATPGVVENVGGVLTWSLRNSFSAGVPDYRFGYGLAGSQPVVGDWNNDRLFTPGIYNPTNGYWQLRNENTGGSADAGTFLFGPVTNSLIALAGDFDGLP